MVNRLDALDVLKGIGTDAWEGDEHTDGVYFTETHAFVINKVMAIRIEHDTIAPPVFLRFKSDNLDELVTTDYPYVNMKRKPQKRFLLFKDVNLSLKEVHALFKKSEETIVLPVSILREWVKETARLYPQARQRKKIVFSFKKEAETVTSMLEEKQELIKVQTTLNICCVANLSFRVNAYQLEQVCKVLPVDAELHLHTAENKELHITHEFIHIVLAGSK